MRALVAGIALVLVVALAAPAMADGIDYDWIATKADKDATHGKYSGGHAFWLPKFGSDYRKFVFEGDGRFTEFDDGTATMTGTIVSTGDDGLRFTVDLTFSNLKSFTNLGAGQGPKLELKEDAYTEPVFDTIDNDDVFNIDPTTWRYYELDTGGTLTGLSDMLGVTLTLDHKPADKSLLFQVGEGANGKNLGMGLSGWFSYSSSNTSLIASGGGDINVDLTPVPEPSTLALMGLGLGAVVLRRRRRQATA